MNRSAFLRLLEVAGDARRVADELQAGEFDEDGEVAFQVEFEHLMGHLALAWHYSPMTDEQISALSPGQFATLMDAIPKVGVTQRLVEPWETVV